MAKISHELIQTAVLKSFEVGLEPAAKMFGIRVDDLADYRACFIEQQYGALNPAPIQAVTETPRTGFWVWMGHLRQNVYFDISAKIVLAVLLILICWATPYVLQQYIDPLTNSVVWLGFTSAYIVVFGGLVVELVLFVQHKVNFDFLNPFMETGAGDYTTLMRSTELTPFEKCRLNQAKYLSYLFAYCVVIMALASLMQGRL